MYNKELYPNNNLEPEYYGLRYLLEGRDNYWLKQLKINKIFNTKDVDTNESIEFILYNN